ncbi:hypothetical protein ACFWOL_30805 [Streptomyces sp. NPDC058442]
MDEVFGKGSAEAADLTIVALGLPDWFRGGFLQVRRRVIIMMSAQFR